MLDISAHCSLICHYWAARGGLLRFIEKSRYAFRAFDDYSPCHEPPLASASAGSRSRLAPDFTVMSYFDDFRAATMRCFAHLRGERLFVNTSRAPLPCRLSLSASWYWYITFWYWWLYTPPTATLSHAIATLSLPFRSTLLLFKHILRLELYEIAYISAFHDVARTIWVDCLRYLRHFSRRATARRCRLNMLK